ncbi:hypothetical protein B0H13DRAFT_1921153 [Mycena leptocephala]|nr:hypothetical protein B0H13DRAFT_1921153 [Mycena leptocephala]
MAGKTVAGKTMAGKTVAHPKKRRTAKFTTAKRSTGAPAPRLALGSNIAVPSTSAPLSAVVPFRTSGNMPNTIRVAGADWEILGHGVFDERLNGAGDGTSTASCAAMVVKSSSALSSRPVRLVSASHALTVLALPFCCPQCHLNREMYWRSRTKETDEFIPQPYQGFMGRHDGKTIVFKSGAVFALEDLPLACTPIPMLAQFLECMFPDNFGYIPVTFNIGSDAGMRNLQEATSALAESLKTGELCM